MKEFKYQMSEAMAKELMKNKKGEEKQMRPQEFLCHWVNQNCGIMGNCIQVTTTKDDFR